MAGEEAKRKGPLKLDSEKLFVEEEEEEEAEPSQLVVVVGKRPQSPETKRMDEEGRSDQTNELRNLSDKSLLETVTRMKRNLSSLIATLKDGGEKYKVHLKRHEDELERRCLQKGETVVLVDEEEVEVEEKTTQANERDSCKNTKIYYPSRDDPVSVEICDSDMDCLAPEKYLSSTIMNFYIRYLQMEELTSKTTDKERYNYHFFNTYFYEKLKEAVAKKKIGGTSFAKFRRWWKGVNIFEKAYILLPVHENLHWSLVIICIPDVEDCSGLIILHLDSLRLHCSKQIFNNIKSFLIEECNFLKGGEAPLDLPIADTVLENLSGRIDERIIEVPQQSNDYDCGLFVLFFMKRFIEEAPERLKKKDLAMFGKDWFNPEEASSLRRNICCLLKEKFKNASQE